MAQELDSQALQRLQKYYGEMSDGELLGVAERPDDLTAMAREVMRGEMAARKLKVEDAQPEMGHRWASDSLGQRSWAPQSVAGVILGASPELDASPPRTGVGPGEVSLMVFHDALELGQAGDFLEAAEVTFRVVDVAQPRGGLGIYDSPPVALSLIVAKTDRERAMAVLRKEMGLFPLQEVEESDPVVDDGTVAVLGDFGRREDADDVAKALDEARIWHRVTANPEGSAADENAYTLEVREIDLVKAGDVVEKAMNLPEG
ncbi:MAG: hypothetical protein ABSG84_00980 [Acidobacteriaceae bacterium]|jgi:hypothetical protein